MQLIFYEDKWVFKVIISNQLEFDKMMVKIIPVSHLKINKINPYLYHFHVL